MWQIGAPDHFFKPIKQNQLQKTIKVKTHAYSIIKYPFKVKTIQIDKVVIFDRAHKEGQVASKLLAWGSVGQV